MTPQQDRDKARAYHRANKDKRAAYQRAYRARPDFGQKRQVYLEVNGERVKARARQYYWENRDRQRSNRLKRQYGLTLEQFEAMAKEQSGCCAICRRKPIRGPLHVDHDHDTGNVRGLLCNPCNRFLAKHHSPETLRRAAAYLEAKDAAVRAKLFK